MDPEQRTLLKPYQLPRAREASARSALPWLLVMGCVVSVLCMPFLRMVGWLGDEGVLLDGAQRMIHGDVIYRDFFEILPPGGFLITDVWFRVFGITIISARVLGIIVIAGISCCAFLCCQLVSRNSWLSASTVLAWVITSQGGWWTVVYHDWFTTFFALCAACVVLMSTECRRLGHPFWAAVFAGAAGMVTPTRGACVMLAALVPFVTHRRQPLHIIAFISGAVLVPMILVSYLLWEGALAQALYDIIVFPATRYESIHALAFGRGASLMNLPLLCIFPASAVLLLWYGIVEAERYLYDPQLQICAAFAIAGAVGCWPRPDVTHIAFATPLAFPFLTLAVSELMNGARSPHWMVAFILGLSLCIPALARFVWREEAALNVETQNTPRGQVALVGLAKPAAPLIMRISASPKFERYFFYPYMPLMPFLTDREQQAQVDIFIPGYTLPSQYQSACLSSLSTATWFVLDETWIEPNFLKIVYPAMKNPRPFDSETFNRIILSSSTLVKKYGPFELRRRNANVNIRICNGIVREGE